MMTHAMNPHQSDTHTQSGQPLREVEMSEPKRIQRKRTKGYRLPQRATCVTRPGKFGNPFETAAEFRGAMYLLDNGISITGTDDQISRMTWIHDNLHKLKGFDLACWCSLDADCHADVLLEYANR